MRTICCGAARGAASAPRPAGRRTRRAKKTIVFLGDSLSAGSGVKPQEAFPALVAEKIRERGLPFEVVNAGVGGDTTAGGLRRLDWLLQRKIDVLVLELGGNDGLRGLPVGNIKANLQAMIDKAKAKNPEVKIVVAGMQMPPNVGAKYADEFRQALLRCREGEQRDHDSVPARRRRRIARIQSAGSDSSESGRPQDRGGRRLENDRAAADGTVDPR